MRYIWIGASVRAERLMAKWRKLDKELYPTIFLDNDSGKVGTYLQGVPIDSVANIRKHLVDRYEIIITTAFVDEIKSQLHEMNIYENIIDYFEKDKIISKSYLEKNIYLHHKKTSKRCFIIGNGPSLRELDLQLILNEDKIMVNHFYKDDELVKLKPQFWTIADPAFWIDEKEFLDPVINTLKSRLTSTQLLIRDEALSYVTKDILSKNNISFYSLDRVANYEPTKIDFTGVLPVFAQNVVSVALMLAIYLNYEEIILIGCDHSWWNYSKEEIDEGVYPPHFYQKNEKDNNYYMNKIKQIGHEALQETIRIQKQEYAVLREIAEQNNIQVYNATPGGCLESFLRIKYEELF